MRFYLDNDVDAGCLKPLRDAGHEAWTTSEAGRSRATDEEQAIYAAEMDAVLITHDRRFGSRERERCHGRLVVLRIDQPDGPTLLGQTLSLIVPTLDRMKYVVIEVRSGGNFEVTAGKWV